MPVTRRHTLAALAGGVLLALTGCADEWESDDDDADCDAGDLKERDPDCGYYDSNGAWVLYPWVHATKGGKPPAGKRPKPPKGVKGGPPRGSSGGGTRGGGGRSGSGGSSRGGGGRR